jgi:hypothetical protein
MLLLRWGLEECLLVKQFYFKSPFLLYEREINFKVSEANKKKKELIKT